MLFALVLALGLLPASAFAAASEEEALGEINIFNGGYRMNYLAMNGQVPVSYTHLTLPTRTVV